MSPQKKSASCRPADVWKLFKIFNENSAVVDLVAMKKFLDRKESELAVSIAKKKEAEEKASLQARVAELEAALASQPTPCLGVQIKLRR